MASEKQIAANQRNAQHSTGPRDTSRTSQNAVKHGLTATELTKLDLTQHAKMAEVLAKHFRPVGPVEEWLVAQIAQYMVRQRRAAAIEMAYLAQQSQHRTVLPDPALELAAMQARILGHGEGLSRCVLLPEDISQINNSVGRYETALENKLYRALHELEREQRRRQGEHVPAPATGELNIHGTDSTTLVPGNAAYIKSIQGEEL